MRKNRKLRCSVLVGAAASAVLWSAWGQAQDAKPAPAKEADQAKAAAEARAVTTKASEGKAAPTTAEARTVLKRTAPVDKTPEAAHGGVAKAADAQKPTDAATQKKAGEERDAEAAPDTLAEKRSTQARGLSLALGKYQEARRALMVAGSEHPSSEDAKKARKEALAQLAEARDAILAQHLDEVKAYRARPEKERESLEEEVDERRKEQKKDRKERAEEARSQLKKRFGEEPLHPAVREELRAHAWRVARLKQLLLLAQADGQAKAAERAEALLKKAEEAHEARISLLMEKPEIKNYEPPISEKAEETAATKAVRAESEGKAERKKPTAAGQPTSADDADEKGEAE